MDVNRVVSRRWDFRGRGVISDLVILGQRSSYGSVSPDSFAFALRVGPRSEVGLA